MKMLFDFIVKANQVVIFFLGIAGLIIASYTTLSLIGQPRYRTEVPITQNRQGDQKVTISNVKWLGRVSGDSYFGIVQKVVMRDRTSGPLALKSSGGFGSSDWESGGEIVNVVISNSSNQIRKLLPVDGLILSHTLAFDYRDKTFRASYFRCVTQDTNGNQKLDTDDRSDLYIVPADNSKPQFLVENAIDDSILTDSTLLVKSRQNDEIQFFEVDINTQERKEIRWR